MPLINVKLIEDVFTSEQRSRSSSGSPNGTEKMPNARADVTARTCRGSVPLSPLAG